MEDVLSAPQGERIAWSALPDRVRAAVEAGLGSRVVAVTPRVGGFSPGVAAGLTLASGDRVFVKAVGVAQNPDAVRLYRREVEVNSWLPRGTWAPSLLWALVDDPEWVALVFSYVDAPTPSLPWRWDDVSAVLSTVRAVHESLDPAPADALTIAETHDYESLRSWAGGARVPSGVPGVCVAHLDRLASLESEWVASTEGSGLLHMDLRHDNVLVRDGRVWLVDWPWAVRGAAFFDVVAFAQSVELYGGPPAAEVFARWDTGGAVPPAAVASALAALSGFFVSRSLLPAPPGVPYLRAVQARQGEVCLRWLAAFEGWPS